MTDEQLVAAFGSTELPGDQFTLTNHVYILIIAEPLADYPNWSWDQCARGECGALTCERARQAFVLPDRVVATPAA